MMHTKGVRPGDSNNKSYARRTNIHHHGKRKRQRYQNANFNASTSLHTNFMTLIDARTSSPSEISASMSWHLHTTTQHTNDTNPQSEVKLEIGTEPKYNQRNHADVRLFCDCKHSLQNFTPYPKGTVGGSYADPTTVLQTQNSFWFRKLTKRELSRWSWSKTAFFVCFLDGF